MWDAGLFDERSTELLARRLETVLHSVSQAQPEQSLRDLPVLSTSERSQILSDWNRTACSYDRNQTIHQAFEAQVTRTPEATALVHENLTLSYAQLNSRANAVAKRLCAMGVGPGVHVGVYLARSADLLVATLGVLKAGGAYVPLDPAYPSERVAHYIADSKLSIVITQAALHAGLPNSDADVLDIASVPNEEIPNIDGGATADDLAYIIYTSGSTGTPKGVMVEHRNVSNFFAGMDDRIDHARGGVWLAVTSLSFDISVLELFWTLARGFKLVLMSDENRAAVSNGPIAVSDRHIDFNLMYWGNDDGPGPQKYQLLLEGANSPMPMGSTRSGRPSGIFMPLAGPTPTHR